MPTTSHLEEVGASLHTLAQASFILLVGVVASACSFDESKLRARASGGLDGAIDQEADAGAARADAGASVEVGQIDSGAPDQASPSAGEDAAQGLDGQDSGGANPETTLDGAIDRAPDAYAPDGDAPLADSREGVEVALVDSGAADGPAPMVEGDAAADQSGQDGNGAGSDAVLDGAIDDSAGAMDQSAPMDGRDAASGQDGEDAGLDANADTSTGPGLVNNGTYRVIARHSGKALDVLWQATADGSNVGQWVYERGKNQQWTFTHLGENVYAILGVQSGKALEAATMSTADDTNVDIRTYTGAANQQWLVSALSGGYYRLSPMSSSASALDVGGVSTADGANIHIWTWLGGSNYNQQWSLLAP
jgi:hypothetical protein